MIRTTVEAAALTIAGITSSGTSAIGLATMQAAENYFGEHMDAVGFIFGGHSNDGNRSMESICPQNKDRQQIRNARRKDKATGTEKKVIPF